MIPMIGVMAGFYIITRMCELIASRAKEPKLGFTGFMAIITILAAVATMAYLIIGAETLGKMLPG